jgi:uncharacterized protein YebE (UPF0316 family)
VASSVGSAAAMAALAMLSVGLWTLRVAVTARGKKLLGAVVAAVEALVFTVAFTSLASHLDAPARVLGYAVGVAGGTLLGLFVDEHLSHGESEVRVVVHGRDARLPEALHGLGWPATSLVAEGPTGPVTLLFVDVDDTRLHDLIASLRDLVPDAFWTVHQLRRIHPVPLPQGFVQAGAGLRPSRSPSAAVRRGVRGAPPPCGAHEGAPRAPAPAGFAGPYPNHRRELRSPRRGRSTSVEGLGPV